MTNVGYAHVEFFDSIEGVAAAKRELIEALPRDGVAVLNADDPRVLGFRDAHPGRSVTFGFSEGADVRAEAAEYGADGARFRAAGRGFRDRPGGPARGDEPAGGHRGGARIRHRAGAPAGAGSNLRRRPDARRAHRARRHRDLERLLQLQSRGGAVDDRRVAQTPAARRIAVLGEMLELGRAAEELHRQVGRYAAEHGVDWLIGVRGQARSMVEAAVAAGLPRGRAHFFEDPAEAGEFARQTARPGDAVLSRVRAACAWSGRWKGSWPNSDALLSTLRTALPILQPASASSATPPSARRFASLTALFLCIALGPWLIDKLRAVSDRPVHPRGRPEVAPEEGRHAHHGRRADHHLHRGSDAVVGGPALSLRVDRASPRCWASAGSASWTTTPRSPSGATWA